MKLNGMCPICYIKRAFTGIKKMPEELKIPPLKNCVSCPTPPMGWSSWNCFRGNIDEGKIIETANSLIKSGLLKAGYKYLNLDDCWQSSLRTDKGEMQGDLINFPMGIHELYEKLHEMGFKCGIYSSNGTATCEDYPASLYKEKIDADTFIKMGADYLKYDFCHNEKIPDSAQLISKIELTNLDTGESKEFPLESLKKYGFAKIRTLEKQKVITGLDKGAGAVEFYTEQKSGKYALTVTFVKHGNYKKYLGVIVGNDYYEIESVKTRAWSMTGRGQAIIELKEIIGSYGNRIFLLNPIKNSKDSAYIQYRRMGEAFYGAGQKAGREVVFSICEWGWNKPYLWGKDAGNLWRTTCDIRPWWFLINRIYRHNLKLCSSAGVGAYNDPDMLEVGNGKLTTAQNKTHFSLWCMMAAPLVLGNDIRKFIKPDNTADTENEILKILTNKELIEIDQDSLCKPAKLIKRTLSYDIIARPLKDGIAVLVYNKRKSKKTINFNINEILKDSYLSKEISDTYLIKELWSGDRFETNGNIKTSLLGQSVAVYKF